MKTYLFGGRLGDLIHGLIIPKYIYDTTGERAHILMSEIGDKFTAGMEKTYNGLIPIMQMQDFIESFRIFNGETLDYTMFMFRMYPRIEADCWTDIYFNSFLPAVRPVKNYSWLIWEKPGEDGSLLVSRKFILDASTARYLEIIKGWPGPVNFMAADKEQYEKSGLMDCATFKHTPELTDMFAAINGCSCFLGDQSAPMAMASALGKKRIVELNRARSHYEYEIQYSDNITTFHYGYVPDAVTR